MKKIISLLLILVCVTSIFAGCEKELSDDDDVISEETPSDEKNDDDEETTKIDITLTCFTGTAYKTDKDDTLNVIVDESYIDELGSVVYVTMEDLDRIWIYNGDHIDVIIKSAEKIKGTSYITIHAEKVIPPEHEPVAEKPVIYLYPEEDTLCSVKVDLDGKLTCTYPDHGNDGWQNFVARPDGTLVFPDGKEYYCLYWEGVANMTPDFSKGFCVKGEDTAEFLSDILLEIGLTPREANEFIIYWLPILQGNEYNLISFQRDAYTDIANLIIDPAPDSLLRVYMVAKPLDSYTEIEPQVFDGFVRDGFTVVEWGGSIIQ